MMKTSPHRGAKRSALTPGNGTLLDLRAEALPLLHEGLTHGAANRLADLLPDCLDIDWYGLEQHVQLDSDQTELPRIAESLRAMPAFV